MVRVFTPWFVSHEPFFDIFTPWFVSHELFFDIFTPWFVSHEPFSYFLDFPSICIILVREALIRKGRIRAKNQGWLKDEQV